MVAQRLGSYKGLEGSEFKKPANSQEEPHGLKSFGPGLGNDGLVSEAVDARPEVPCLWKPPTRAIFGY
jgi:hypothetical protein